ncbi:type II toxin-antitoxin system Phd/YefM family antitoxin [Massilia cavernae]|uniref:Type II toxin-antitoxin system prevent-host-death family antitoxin n=1 Tax=Massilia cavernae TaxID=2320864 RepID=A0A418XT37_9BURK|nr:type II toxin-antitoxin system prevent-host-death family antitoxin [Massilia cavernae]RJG15779.1 type II toxin-antitoxin system prevent-host-death family antitoxin [Massilia cavernae]
MKSLTVHEAQIQLTELVDAVVAGEDVVLVKNGIPVAQLVRIDPPAKRPRPAGLFKGKIKVADDFDAPLPDEVLDGFEGR